MSETGITFSHPLFILCQKPLFAIFFFKDLVLLPLSPDFCQSVKETIRATPSHWANTLNEEHLDLCFNLHYTTFIFMYLYK